MVCGCRDAHFLGFIGAGVWRMVICSAAAALPPPVATRTASQEAPEGPVALVEPSPPASAQGTHPFADKATGDWGGLRQQLKEAGVTIGFDTALEGFKNFRGGLDTHDAVGAATLDLNMALDTEKLFNWRGGRFYVDMEYHAGQDPSEVLVGDLQVFDKLNAPAYLQFFEMWYEQKLLGDKLRLKVGKVDANTEFSVIDNGLSFLNSSSQVSPTLFVLPTTPDPMPGINLFVTPNESYYAGFGAYYSNRSVRLGNLVGNPQDAQSSKFGAFMIGETGLRWGSDSLLRRDGNLKAGAWVHTGTFSRLGGSGPSEASAAGGSGSSTSVSPGQGSAGSTQEGVHGYYLIVDQTLWQPSQAKAGGPGVRCFLEYGATRRTVNTIDHHAGGGITWTGLFPGRPDDVLGFTPQYAQISSLADLPRSYEMAFELFYRLKISPWLILQPDLQYIANPGGQYPDAVVATLRLEMHF
jgi:porin